MQLINHASLRFSEGRNVLIIDPWLTGRVFDNGWDHLATDTHTLTSLEPSYIWLSHEHPDHFPIPDLRSVDEERRKGILILAAHRDNDRKILDFCDELGYQTSSIPSKQPELLEGTTWQLRSGAIGSDAWLHISHETGCYLDTNDCQFGNDAIAQAVADQVGRVDVLLTQFTYANWVGNPGDLVAVEAARELVKANIQRQVRIFKPAYVVLFAGFIYWCHEENSWMNDLTGDDLTRAIEWVLDCGATPIVLQPGEEWEPGMQVDNNTGLGFWRHARESALQRPAVTGKPYPIEDLCADILRMIQKLRENNDLEPFTNGSAKIPPTLIRVNGTSNRLRLDITASGNNVLEVLEDGEWDIAATAEALSEVFRYPWGRGTLTVNGRFSANYATLRRFIQQTQLWYLNNTGRFFPRDITAEEIINPQTFVLRVADALSSRSE